MTTQKAKKHPKHSSQKKITGIVTKLTPNEIRLANAKGIWRIDRTPSTKVIGGTLKQGSTVTVQFNKKDGKIIEPPQPGKRTETGTVIGLTAQQIRLDNTTPDSGPWRITRTEATAVLSGNLALGAMATIISNDVDWQILA